jgi:hypothetical protein
MKAPGPETRNRGHSRLQLGLLDLGYKPTSVIGQEGRHDAEIGVTEAADVYHLGGGRSGVRHDGGDVIDWLVL